MTEEKMIYDSDEVIMVARDLKKYLADCRVMTFSGSLGAGKTMLVRQLLRTCGIKKAITSPTFNYVNSYRNDQGQVFHHFDLYRVSSLDEFREAGFDEYLYQDNSWCFIEWPAVIEPLLAKQVCQVKLDYQGTDKRKLSLICY